MSNRSISIGQILAEARNQQLHNVVRYKHSLKNILTEGEEDNREIAAEALGRLAEKHPDEIVVYLDDAVTAAIEDPNATVRGNAMALVACTAVDYPEKVAMYTERVSDGLADENDTVVNNSIETLAHVTDIAPQGVLDQIDRVISLLSSNNDKERYHSSIVLYNVSLNYPSKISPYNDQLLDILSDSIVDEKVKIALAGTLQNLVEENPDELTESIGAIHTVITNTNDHRIRGNLTGAIAAISEDHPEEVIDHANSFGQLLYDASNYENKLNLTNIIHNIVKHDPRIFQDTNMARAIREVYKNSNKEEIHQNISLIIRHMEQNKNILGPEGLDEFRSDLGEEILNNFKDLANAAGEQIIFQFDSFINEMKNENKTSYEIDGVADIDNPQSGVDRRNE